MYPSLGTPALYQKWFRQIDNEQYNSLTDSCTGCGGFKVGVARGKTKKGGPLMTSSYSANRVKHFDQA